MKLAAKFARQETETVRLARIGRRRISKEREAAIRRMLRLVNQATVIPGMALQPIAPANNMLIPATINR